MQILNKYTLFYYIHLLTLFFVLGAELVSAASDLNLYPVFDERQNQQVIVLNFGIDEIEDFQRKHIIHLCGAGYSCPANHESLRIDIRTVELPATLINIYVNDNQVVNASYSTDPITPSHTRYSEDFDSLGMTVNFTRAFFPTNASNRASFALRLSLKNAPYFGQQKVDNGLKPCQSTLSVGSSDIKLPLSFKKTGEAPHQVPVNITSSDILCGTASATLSFNYEPRDTNNPIPTEDTIPTDDSYELLLFDEQNQLLARYLILRLNPLNDSEAVNFSPNATERVNILPAPEGLDLKLEVSPVITNAGNIHVDLITSVNVSNITLNYALIRLNNHPCSPTLNESELAGMAVPFTTHSNAETSSDCPEPWDPSKNEWITIVTCTFSAATVVVFGVIIPVVKLYQYHAMD